MAHGPVFVCSSFATPPRGPDPPLSFLFVFGTLQAKAMLTCTQLVAAVALMEAAAQGHRVALQLPAPVTAAVAVAVVAAVLARSWMWTYPLPLPVPPVLWS